MNIQFNIDATKLLRDLPNYEKAVVYSVHDAINATLPYMRKAAQVDVQRKVVVRKPLFLFEPGYFAGRLAFASVSKGRLYGEVFMGEPSKGGPFLLPIMQVGGMKKPSTPGAKNVAVPITGRPARPGINRGIDPRFTFAGLKLTAYRGKKKLTKSNRHRKNQALGLLGEFGRVQTPSQGVQWKGQERTFLLPKTEHAPLGAVFQRFGPERGDIREIWTFIPPFQIPANLGWIEAVSAEAQRRFPDELDRQVTRALVRVRSAR